MKLRNLAICTFIWLMLATGIVHADPLVDGALTALRAYPDVAMSPDGTVWNRFVNGTGIEKWKPGSIPATIFADSGNGLGLIVACHNRAILNPAIPRWTYRDTTGVLWGERITDAGTRTFSRYSTFPAAVAPLTSVLVVYTPTGSTTAPFVRTSSRTYMPSSMSVAAVAANTAAVEPKGVSLEKEFMNLIARSEALAMTPWYASGGAGVAPLVAANSAVAPDGTTTADTLYGSVTNTDNLFQDVSIGSSIANRTFDASWFVKKAGAGTGTTASIRIRNQPGAADAAVNNMTITDAWARYHVGMTFGAGTTDTSIRLQLRPETYSSAPTGNSIHAWGVQLTETKVPFSYVPTPTASTATKTMDKLSITNTSVVSDTAGTVFVTLSPLSASTESVVNSIIGGPGSGLLYRDGANFKSDDGTAVVTLASAWAAGDTLDLCLTWGPGGRKLYNMTAGTSQTGTYDGDLGIGAAVDFFDGVSAPNSNFKEVKFVYNRVLTDAEVAAWR